MNENVRKGGKMSPVVRELATMNLVVIGLIVMVGSVMLEGRQKKFG